MINEGIIRPSTSPFSSPDKEKGWKMAFLCRLSSRKCFTIKDRFLIPTVGELLDELTIATVFAKLDLRFGYHQIRVDLEDCHKTAFKTFGGHYEFLVIPFGLSNAPSTFEAAMNDLLRPHLHRFVLVFFHDILIYRQSMLEHVHHLTTILQLLETHKFFVKESKCAFVATKVTYLGHII